MAVQKKLNAAADDIRHLIVFAHVARTLSISEASRQLGLSPATVSAHVVRLEASLGASLLYRSTRAVSLTDQGQSVMLTAQSILGLYEEGIVQLSRRARSLAGRIRIAVPAVLINCTQFLPVLATFFAKHPDLEPELRFSDRRAEVIADGIDVAFRIGDLPSSSLRFRRLFELPRVLVASPALVRQKRLEHPRELVDWPWIGLSMRRHTRVFIGPDGQEVEIRYVPKSLSDSVEGAMKMAELGLGLSVPPASLATTCSKLVEILPQWRLAPLDVWAVWPGNAKQGDAAQQLVAHVVGSGICADSPASRG